MRLTTCIAAMLALVGESLAYPIAPVTLYELVERADFVVLARVDEVESGVARLRIDESWKGNLAGEVRVSFAEGLICPAPPRYVAGERVLAFLSPSEEGSHLRTVGLSYGTLYPSEEALPLFRRLLRRVEGAPDTSDSEFKRHWAVDAASHRATRWHGLYELAHSADVLHAFYDPERTDTSLHELGKDQLEAVAGGFLQEPSSDVTLPMILTLLRDFQDPELDALSVALVEGLLLQEPPPLWTVESVLLVLERFGDSDPAARLRRATRVDRDPLFQLMALKDDAPALLDLWEAARKELDIPDVSPLVPPSPRRFGVGPDTPP